MYSITGTAGKDGWYRSEVTLTWTVTGEEPLTQTGCDPKLLTADQEQTKYTCTARDAGGEAQVDVIIGIDTSAPVITCSEADPFIFNSGDHIIVPAEVDASQAGLDKSAANLLTGILTTNTVGPKTLTFRAFDLAGNQGEAECSYDVDYNTSGFLPPVEELNSGRAGRTYPVKWQLTDFAGLFISDLSAVEKIEAKRSSICLAGETPPVLVPKASVPSTLHYDTTDNQYIYNWRTPRTRGCYALEVTLASGQMMTAYFDIK
jgi:hypothetical protein